MGSSLSRLVQADQLLAHLKALEGERHPSTSPERLEAAQRYVTDQWCSWNLTVSSDEFSYMGERFVNLIARPPACPPGPRLIIGAHVDTVIGTPGADDNASGISAMLELARVAAPVPWRVPVEFVAFALEELGMVGSSHYAARLRRERAALRGMLSLEMLGFTESEGRQRYPAWLAHRYPPVGNYIGLAANRRSRTLLDVVAVAMRTVEGLPVETIVMPANGWVVPESRLSDHSPFWDRGYPALLVTDTAFLRNPHYHQPSDTVETLDLPFLAKVTQGLVAVVETLAG
jgi:Zn-dependent M28 family amino/carboxypeptidase